jgi:hypothetical protein
VESPETGGRLHDQPRGRSLLLSVDRSPTLTTHESVITNAEPMDPIVDSRTLVVNFIRVVVTDTDRVGFEIDFKDHDGLDVQPGRW